LLRAKIIPARDPAERTIKNSVRITLANPECFFLLAFNLFALYASETPWRTWIVPRKGNNIAPQPVSVLNREMAKSRIDKLNSVGRKMRENSAAGLPCATQAQGSEAPTATGEDASFVTDDRLNLATTKTANPKSAAKTMPATGNSNVPRAKNASAPIINPKLRSV